MIRLRRSVKAFTLVELLVVVAVISILAGLLLPVLSKALASAHQVSCASNLKQIGVASQTYADDFRGWIPCALSNPYISSFSGAPGGQPWNRLLTNWSAEQGKNYAWLEYAQTIRVFRCSAEPELRSSWGDLEAYGYNRYLGEQPTATGALAPKRFSGLRKPAADIFLADTDEGHYIVVGIDLDYRRHSDRHNSGSNFLYCDLHVTYRKSSDATYTSSGDYGVE
jgi:prepilin-type N-terminal cleavage/methylation domain-containing protein/prepilin-type processing-associated H-X9-DG protein